MALPDSSPEATANHKKFESHISDCSRNLTLGLFDAALECADEATNLARSPSERASAAVMKIQCLEEVQRSEDASLAAVQATSDPETTALTNDLTLTAASLALHRNDTTEAQRILEMWLDARLADDRLADVSSAKDAQLVRMLVLDVIKPTEGTARATDSLGRATELLSESEFRSIHCDILANQEEGEPAHRAQDGTQQTGESPAIAPSMMTVPHQKSFNDFAQKLCFRISRWLRTNDDLNLKFMASVVFVTTALWFTYRARAKSLAAVKLLRESIRATFKIAFGSALRGWNV